MKLAQRLPDEVCDELRLAQFELDEATLTPTVEHAAYLLGRARERVSEILLASDAAALRALSEEKR